MSKSTMRGFTMLEVLITIVVIAFGLLGVAGLQAFAVKNNQSASMRLVATGLAADMVDRIHSNARAAYDGKYNKTSPSDYTNFACATGTTCTSDQIAATDLAQWAQQVARVLPNGTGIVCIDPTPNDGVDATDHQCATGGSFDHYVVKIWWRDDRTRTGNPAAPQRFTWPFIP